MKLTATPLRDVDRPNLTTTERAHCDWLSRYLEQNAKVYLTADHLVRYTDPEAIPKAVLVKLNTPQSPEARINGALSVPGYQELQTNRAKKELSLKHLAVIDNVIYKLLERGERLWEFVGDYDRIVVGRSYPREIGPIGFDQYTVTKKEKH